MQRASGFIYKRRLKRPKSHCKGGTKPLVNTMTLGSSLPRFLLRPSRPFSALAGLLSFSSTTGLGGLEF